MPRLPGWEMAGHERTDRPKDARISIHGQEENMRARNIKPGFFKNEHLADCSPSARLLFIGLWMLADREGRLEYRPKRWKGELFPYENEDAAALFSELENAGGLVVKYAADGVQYVWIPHFLDHQRPHQNESASTIPPYTCDQGEKDLSPRHEVIATKDQSDPAESLFSESLSSDSLNPDSGMLNAEGSSEPEAASKPSPVVSSIPIVGKGGGEGPVTQADVDEWQALFPAVDVMQEIRNIRAWNLANPSKRKTASGYKRHIVSWLSKEQNRGGNQRHGAQRPSAESKVERAIANGQEWLAMQEVRQ